MTYSYDRLIRAHPLRFVFKSDMLKHFSFHVPKKEKR